MSDDWQIAVIAFAVWIVFMFIAVSLAIDSIRTRLGRLEGDDEA